CLSGPRGHFDSSVSPSSSRSGNSLPVARILYSMGLLSAHRTHPARVDKATSCVPCSTLVLSLPLNQFQSLNLRSVPRMILASCSAAASPQPSSAFTIARSLDIVFISSCCAGIFRQFFHLDGWNWYSAQRDRFRRAKLGGDGFDPLAGEFSQRAATAAATA